MKKTKEMGLVLFCAVVASCGTVTEEGQHAPPRTSHSSETASASSLENVDENGTRPESVCDSRIPVFENGETQRSVCPQDLQHEGLTVVNLAGDWTPAIFRNADGAAPQPYRENYLALADERLTDLPRDVDREKYLELYGIFPTFRVLKERLADEERHLCHDAVDDEVLDRMTETLRPWSADQSTWNRRARSVTYLRNRLESARESRGLESIDDLASDPEYSRLLARFEEDRVPVESVTAIQQHLACDGLNRARPRAGVFDWRTAAGLKEYQRLHMVVSGGFLDAPSRAAARTDSREADFRALLRSLRERVISATGLIEDGSAGRNWALVLDRTIDPPQFHADLGHGAEENSAPDLIGPATEVAARALGWVDPAAARQALAEGELPAQVAIALPPVPEYHSEHMELEAVVDRGDVIYSFGGRGRAVERRPAVTLFAVHEGRRIALMRWATTIGGWKPETDPEGVIGLRYKNSPAGPRIWRDVIASPAWLPPPATPDGDLIRGGRLYRSITGPGYRSAYGLTMVVHHKVREGEEGEEPRYIDEGIRAHGSVSYRSILSGTSHGCHRLYNHLAVRLNSFLLTHRTHIRHGPIAASFARTVTIDESPVTLRVSSRGYRFELTPPIQVTVLEGNVIGGVTRPPLSFRPLPETLAAEALAAAAADEGE